MAKYGFFLGCIMPLRYPGIESSTREVIDALGVEPRRHEGASCCPAPGVMRSFDQTYWMTRRGGNLVIAEKMGVDVAHDMQRVLRHTVRGRPQAEPRPRDEEEGQQDPQGRDRDEYNGDVNVRHFVELLYKDVGVEAIRAKAKAGKNLKAAVPTAATS